MAIKGISSKKELHDFIIENLSRSHPVEVPEKLYGRERELELIEDALYSPCTQVFIVGDRGVGKSSVGIISAASFQSNDNQFVYVECGPTTTFESIIANIVYKTIKQSRIYSKSETLSKSLVTGIKNILSFSQDNIETSVLQDVEQQIRNVTDAYRIVEWLQDNHSDQPVVMIDEFDRMADAERAKFADLVKHIGDQRNKVKFIFTGIASNVHDLIGQHQSCTRQIESIVIPRLNFDYRWDIIEIPLRKLNITIDREILIRISLISDGFPYYIHLLTEKLLLVLFKDQNLIDEVLIEHYEKAIENAIETCATDFSTPYNKAVLRRNDIYEAIVWSTADTELLIRTTEELYVSYIGVAKQTKTTPIERNEFSKCLANLTKKSFGPILKRENDRRGLFTYEEKMLRGYVRLQAESHGVLLHDTGHSIPRPISASATSTRVGYNASKIPVGVRLKGETKRKENN